MQTSEVSRSEPPPDATPAVDVPAHSAATGEGMDDLFAKIDDCREEYRREYVPFLEERKAQRKFAEEARKAGDVERLGEDLSARAKLNGDAD